MFILATMVQQMPEDKQVKLASVSGPLMKNMLSVLELYEYFFYLFIFFCFLSFLNMDVEDLSINVVIVIVKLMRFLEIDPKKIPTYKTLYNQAEKRYGKSPLWKD
jgi:hypothetical protein